MKPVHGVIIVLLIILIIVLRDYAVLVPKAVVFMNDVHFIRSKADEWNAQATDIKQTLKNIESKFSFLKEDYERRGQPWPADR